MKSLRFLLSLASAGILALSVAQAAADKKASSGASCPMDKPAKECCAEKAACKDKKAECADKAACCKDKKADAPKG